MDARRLVGQNVRKYRLAADLSQEQVAEKMGMDRAYVSGLELGNRNPTIITMWMIAGALNVKLSQLVDESSVTLSGVKTRKRATKNKLDRR